MPQHTLKGRPSGPPYHRATDCPSLWKSFRLQSWVDEETMTLDKGRQGGIYRCRKSEAAFLGSVRHSPHRLWSVRCLSTQRVEFIFPGHWMHQGLTPSSVNHMTGLVQNHRHFRAGKDCRDQPRGPVLFVWLSKQCKVVWAIYSPTKKQNDSRQNATCD